jgi:glyceraldehyde-3-phosphate dehydrogenase/erythrose-4-phosphate dehydrogenase
LDFFDQKKILVGNENRIKELPNEPKPVMVVIPCCCVKTTARPHSTHIKIGAAIQALLSGAEVVQIIP